MAPKRLQRGGWPAGKLRSGGRATQQESGKAAATGLLKRLGEGWGNDIAGTPEVVLWMSWATPAVSAVPADSHEIDARRLNSVIYNDNIK
jgi:hypothetical protein